MTAPVVTKDAYLKDGKAYRRVTTILDAFSGKGDSGSAASRMTATGLADVMMNVEYGIVHTALDGHLENIPAFLASKAGQAFVAGRYWANLGQYADMGTIVDMAMVDVLKCLAMGVSPEFDWPKFVIDAIATMDYVRELNAAEIEAAESAQDLLRVRELSALSRFPVAVDLDDCVKRINDGLRWLVDRKVDPICWQAPLFDPVDMVAGTPDLVAKIDGYGDWIIDFKTSNHCPKKEHAAQVVKYGDMWERETGHRVSRYTVLYLTKDGPCAYDVQDAEGARSLFTACLSVAKLDTPFARRGVVIRGSEK